METENAGFRVKMSDCMIIIMTMLLAQYTCSQLESCNLYVGIHLYINTPI